MAVHVPVPALVVLIGPPASGKSTWAAEHFRPDQVVSTDALRALVGEGEHDQRAGTDAFAVLDLVLERRLKRRLLTVVDSLGTDAKRRRKWIESARRRGVATIAVVFDVPVAECRARNRARTDPVPTAFLSTQLESWPATRDAVADDGFDAVVEPGAVRLTPAAFAGAAARALDQRERPVPLDFALQIPRFDWPGGSAETADRLQEIASAAEHAGFRSIWVMDHFLQIPQAGREWDDMLESYSTLSWLAAVTDRVGLGALVTGVTYRNLAHLGKIVATLDVLSRGRAWCGIGAAWFEREHRVYGWPFPPLSERYPLLEDALELLPLLWGPGSPAFEGRTVQVPEAICYPRPLQEHVPILVGGSGERRTLRLVAQHADACNVFGDPATVAHKINVLHGHCRDVGRDPSEILVTNLSTVLVGRSHAEVDELVAAGRPTRSTPEAYAAAVNAATVEDHVGRFREYADTGLGMAIVNFPTLSDAKPIERFAEVIAAFR